jgi:hypothetical protein
MSGVDSTSASGVTAPSAVITDFQRSFSSAQLASARR